MGVCRVWVIGALTFLLTVPAMVSPAQAWYGHRSNRSYRMGRMNNRLAGVQRASSALGAAQSRLYGARVNAARQVRQARYQAQHSSGLASARLAEQQGNHDYQAARDQAVNQLKSSNPQFRDLLAQCDAKRTQIAALAKSGDTTGQMQSLEADLRTMARKVSLMENSAINSDPAVKQIASQKPDLHASVEAAEKAAQQAVAQNPAVQAAERQLSQAEQQAQQAASRYNSALGSVNSGGMYGRNPYRRRSGYGVSVNYVSIQSGSHRHSVHRSVHHTASRRR
jgi:chromosome segregation ATPase